MLLTRDANLSVIDGRFALRLPGEEPYLDFRYQVIRVWELPAEALLAGGLATLPLAPLGAVRRVDVPSLMRRMGERLKEPDAAEQASELWAASAILMGLKYEKVWIKRLIQEVRGMAESVTIDIFKEWGALEQSRKVILQLGTELFGPPTDEIRAQVQGIESLTRFDHLNIRLLKAKTWDELLAPPPRRPRAKKKPAAG